MTAQPCVWVFTSTYFRWLWKPFAMALAARTGLTPVLIVPSEQDAAFYRKQFGSPFDGEIMVRKDLYAVPFEDDADAPDEAETTSRAMEIEQAFGVSMMRDMILCDRHFGRAFHHNGAGHPLSRIARRATPLRAMRTCVAAFDEAEQIAATHPPELVITYAAGIGIYGKPMTVVSGRNGAVFRSLSPSRFGDGFVWAENEFEDTPRFDAFLQSYRDPTEAEIAEVQRLVQPTGLYTSYADRLPRDLTWRRIAWLCGYEFARAIYYRIRRYRKARIGYFATANMAYYLRQRRDWDRLRGPAMKTLADLDRLTDRKIVYYPLQTDPEASLYGQSCEHSDQFATVRELALSLPANAVLAVKEHIVQLGRRPSVFYDWIDRMPNVVHLRPDIPGMAVTERADLVVTINGSAGYEAAALGKPVIHFSSHGRLLSVPHVHFAAGFRDLTMVREILLDDSPLEAARRARDGARFYLALRDFGLDLADMGIHGRESEPSPAELDRLCNSLLATLPTDGVAAAAGG